MKYKTILKFWGIKKRKKRFTVSFWWQFRFCFHFS